MPFIQTLTVTLKSRCYYGKNETFKKIEYNILIVNNPLVFVFLGFFFFFFFFLFFFFFFFIFVIFAIVCSSALYSPSFGASGKLCFFIVVIPGYLRLYFCSCNDFIGL